MSGKPDSSAIPEDAAPPEWERLSSFCTGIGADGDFLMR